MAHNRKKNVIETLPKHTEILDLLDKDFPWMLLKMQKLKDILDRKLKDIRKTMSHQIRESINRDWNDQKEPNRNSGVKSTVTETKNSMQDSSNR